MSWQDFKSLLTTYGFKIGLEYDITHDENEVDEAIIYYHPQKGLVLWATSFWNKKSINGGTVYGMIEWDDWKVACNVFSGCSHGGNGEDKNIRDFSYDIREGLIHKLNRIDSTVKYLPKWQGITPFLWFVDYNEDDVEGYDYKTITNEKILKCPKELQEIIGSI